MESPRASRRGEPRGRAYGTAARGKRRVPGAMESPRGAAPSGKLRDRGNDLPPRTSPSGKDGASQHRNPPGAPARGMLSPGVLQVSWGAGSPESWDLLRTGVTSGCCRRVLLFPECPLPINPCPVPTLCPLQPPASMVPHPLCLGCPEMCGATQPPASPQGHSMVLEVGGVTEGVPCLEQGEEWPLPGWSNLSLPACSPALQKPLPKDAVAVAVSPMGMLSPHSHSWACHPLSPSLPAPQKRGEMQNTASF